MEFMAWEKARGKKWAGIERERDVSEGNWAGDEFLMCAPRRSSSTAAGGWVCVRARFV